MAVRTGPQPMPGMMPQMPGIMGAPMGPPPGMPPMGGMPGMPPMPMGGMPPPMPMPMGGPMGGPPPQGGRPASLGTLPAPSTAAQRAGFGAAVGAVASGPVPGAMPADVFAGGIPGGMMDASIPRPVAMMRGGGVAYMQEGGDPAAAFRKTFDEIVSGGGIGDVAIKAYQQTGKILPGYESLISAYEAAPAGTYVAPSSGTTRGEPEGGPVGMSALRDSAGDIVPGMFVMRYADGTYSRPGTVLEVEGLRQGLQSGERTSGSLGLEDVRSIADQNQYLKTNGVIVSDVAYAGAGQPFSNEQLGSDMVTVRFADGSMLKTQKGLVDVMQASGALGGMQSAGDFTRAQVALSAGSADPESESARLMNMFNERQLGYDAALRESDPNIARNLEAFQSYAGALSGQPVAGAGMPAGGMPAGGVNPYEAANIYADRGILDQQRGFYEGELDVLRQQLSDLQAAYAGPRYTGVLESSSYGMPEGASYQPTMGTIPTFTRGVSDVFGTRPVTYYGSPQARITSGIGSIDLPARPESVNVFDWLANPVAGAGLYRPGGAS